LGRKYPKL
jgi:hypothetical protein